MNADASTEGMSARQIELRRAARALGRHGLVHAYGHCSLRLDAERFLVCAARPMGLIAPGEAGTVVHVHGPLPDGVLGEVRVHQQVYRRRPDVGAVVRSMPPRLMALGTARRVPSPVMASAPTSAMASRCGTTRSWCAAMPLPRGWPSNWAPARPW
ncbi:class II aldolase/adducin family protein [Ottowia pentelensis]|uniref:class II aldolase/adducin family protein n=1 Tax=Ottowia pentelensis TaxID=511108 RepID=UPI00362F94A3